jgi:hypothetical protein
MFAAKLAISPDRPHEAARIVSARGKQQMSQFVRDGIPEERLHLHVGRLRDANDAIGIYGRQDRGAAAGVDERISKGELAVVARQVRAHDSHNEVTGGWPVA